MNYKKYEIIYADPPWSYNDKMKMKGAHGMIRGAASFYSTMKIDDIKLLPIQDISDENCVLFLWVTMPLLQEGLDVIKAWGFKYKTCGFTWIKTTKNGKLHCGMGHYTRGNAELCLIGTKGKLKRQNNSIYQIVEAKIRKHSQKPNSVRKKIELLYGNINRIELFAREKVKGWDSWGLEIESDIKLGEIK
ncbi:MAG: MT-A70 family methyltransferase [Candidatus Thorarchaeota archaeon]